MTNLVISFIDPSKIRLTPTGTINYQIDKINSDQTVTNIVQSTAISIATDVILSDGIYKVTNITNSVAETVIIYNSIIEHLNANITDILLNGMPQSLYPNNYDFVLASLMSMLILGNNTYQIITYSVENLANYAQIALTFDKVSKYLDIINNTSQSTNALLD